jgi:hypothetical protein
MEGIRMAPRPKKPVNEAIGDIDEQIRALQEKKRGLIKKRAEQVTRLVEASGLADVDISDEVLLSALKDVADRFRSQASA